VIYLAKDVIKYTTLHGFFGKKNILATLKGSIHSWIWRCHTSEYRMHLKAFVLSYYLVFGKCLSYGPPDREAVGINEWAEDDGLVDRELHADPLYNPPAHT
jgi:hypothetical protein